MNKKILILMCIVISVFNFSGVFVDINPPKSIGAGFEDENNYIKLSTQSIAFSYKKEVLKRVEPFFSINLNLNNPLKNNDIQSGINLKYEPFNIGIGVWNSFTETASPTYSGYAGASILLNFKVDKIEVGSNLTFKMLNIVLDENGLNYYFKAFPEDLAQMRGFSAYFGYNFFKDKNLDISFYMNFMGNYSIIPGGLVFYKLNDAYSFDLRVEIWR